MFVNSLVKLVIPFFKNAVSTSTPPDVIGIASKLVRVGTEEAHLESRGNDRLPQWFSHNSLDKLELYFKRGAFNGYTSWDWRYSKLIICYLGTVH